MMIINGNKNNFIAKDDITLRQKRSILKFDNFWSCEFHNGSGTKK